MSNLKADDGITDVTLISPTDLEEAKNSVVIEVTGRDGNIRVETRYWYKGPGRTVWLTLEEKEEAQRSWMIDLLAGRHVTIDEVRTEVEERIRRFVDGDRSALKAIGDRTVTGMRLERVERNRTGFRAFLLLEMARGISAPSGEQGVSFDISATPNGLRCGAFILPRISYEEIQREHDLLHKHEKKGDAARERGDLDAATEHYGLMLAAGEFIVSSGLKNARYPADVAKACTRLGDLARDRGDQDEADQLYLRATKALQKAAGTTGAEPHHLRDLAKSYLTVADRARAQKDVDRAREYYDKKLVIDEQLVEKESYFRGNQDSLSFTFGRLGDLARDTDDLIAADQLYRRKLTIEERLVAAEPKNRRFLDKLAWTNEKLASLDRQQGRADDARVATQREAVPLVVEG